MTEQSYSGGMVCILTDEEDPRLVYVAGNTGLLRLGQRPVTRAEIDEALSGESRARLRTALGAAVPARMELHLAGSTDAVLCTITARDAACVSRGVTFEPMPTDQVRTVHWRLDRHELEEALAAGAFEPWFQPIWQIIGARRIVGYEMLARWRRPGLGVLGADEFIPALRGQGLMRAFGSRLRQQAIHAFFDAARSAPADGLSLSLNLAAPDLLDPGLLEEMESLIADVPLAAGQVRLEITEAELIDEMNAVRVVMDGLRELGMSLVLDDFGAGFSSLTWLEQFPVDAVKIDRHFLLHHRDSANSRRIIQSVVDLAADLGISVVAEGVETEDALTWLQALGCDMAQGYWLGEPIPAEALGAAMTKAHQA